MLSLSVKNVWKSLFCSQSIDRGLLSTITTGESGNTRIIFKAAVIIDLIGLIDSNFARPLDRTKQTCLDAVDWPLLDEWDAELIEGFDAGTN